jgi:hypothetical protein
MENKVNDSFSLKASDKWIYSFKKDIELFLEKQYKLFAKNKFKIKRKFKSQSMIFGMFLKRER